MFSYQKTIKHSVQCIGTGLHSGLKVVLALHPAKENTGIVFRRTDIHGDAAIVPANYKHVSSTLLCTTISNKHGTEVATIEHLMAAFWACGIDNCIVDVDGPEIPIMDGSAEPFIFLIECAGVQDLKQRRHVIEVLKEVSVEENGCRISISPSDGFSVDFEIHYDHQVINRQKASFDARDVCFKHDFSRARTYGLEKEVDMLREKGLAKGGSLDNAIVVSDDGILNEGTLRYQDEFVRHKILDCVGDMHLVGGYIKGQVDAYKSGHALNNKLLHEFFNTEDAWRVAPIPAGDEATMLQYKIA